MRRGLVLSGGAALGAYQAGVLRALNEAGLDFEVISATSIGSINAAAWNIPDVIGELHQHWYDNVSIHKPFDPARVLKAQNPFRYHYTLDQLVNDYSQRYPFGRERSEIIITVADYDTHEIRTFSTSDTSIPEADRAQLVKASTAILHIGSEAVEIQGRRYYDGGYYNNVPIEPLLERDLDEIWIVPLSPIQGDVTPNLRGPKLDFVKRALPHAYTYSLLSFLEQVGNPPSMDRGDARKIVISPFASGAINSRVMGQSLLFSLKTIKHLIDSGYRDGALAVASYYG